MYNHKINLKSVIKKIPFLALLIIFIFILFNVLNWNKNYADEQEIILIEQSVKKAVVNCYALEGVYPQNLDYIEKNYGVSYNHDKYYVDYQIFAPNVFPNIEVAPKGRWTLTGGGAGE